MTPAACPLRIVTRDGDRITVRIEEPGMVPRVITYRESWLLAKLSQAKEQPRETR